MSVTGTYCLWLHSHPSTAELSKLIDSEDWGADEPQKGQSGRDTLYYWPCTIGPFFKMEEGGETKWWPLENLIDEVAQVLPEIDQHYALFVWGEGEYQRTDGHYDYDLHAQKVVMILDPNELHGDYEDHEYEVREFFEEMTRP